MLNNTTYIKLNKLIEADNLNNNELYQLICYLNRRYLDNLVKDNILKVIDNKSVLSDTIEFDSNCMQNKPI